MRKPNFAACEQQRCIPAWSALLIFAFWKVYSGFIQTSKIQGLFKDFPIAQLVEHPLSEREVRVHTDWTNQNSLTFPWLFPDGIPDFPDITVHTGETWSYSNLCASYSEQLCFHFRVIILNYAKFLFKLLSMFVVNSFLFNIEIYGLSDSNYCTCILKLLSSLKNFDVDL